MQGLGGPGVHQLQLTYVGMPRFEGISLLFSPELERLSLPIVSTISNWQESGLPKTLIQAHLKSEAPLKFSGIGAQEGPLIQQFKEFQFPLPESKSGIRMMWTDTPCRTTCWNHGHETEVTLWSPQVEFVVAQHPWLENDCLFADIILPTNTHLEVDDMVSNTSMGGQHADLMLCNKAVEPIGESKSDFEAVLEVAKKFGCEQDFTGGMSTEDLRKQMYDFTGLSKTHSWEEFKERQYHLYQTAEGWENDTPGMRNFYENPEKFGLGTPSKKLEFYSERLAKHFPDDKERPPSPQWIEKSELHDERISSPRAKDYPLLLMSNHGRWRVHSQCDDITWTREAPTMKVTGVDGYKYEPIWIHTSEAEKRGIKSGDIVKVYNERGIVLGGAYVTERLRPGVAYCDHGSRIDPIIPGKVDRGGAINLISPEGTTSKNCVGQATSGYLVNVAKVTGAEWDEWRAANPEAFARPYDAGAGVRFDAWVIQGDGAK
jgi:trimethylamine-N-oxide reductase (cytochrome c)